MSKSSLCQNVSIVFSCCLENFCKALSICYDNNWFRQPQTGRPLLHVPKCHQVTPTNTKYHPYVAAVKDHKVSQMSFTHSRNHFFGRNGYTVTMGTARHYSWNRQTVIPCIIYKYHVCQVVSMFLVSPQRYVYCKRRIIYHQSICIILPISLLRCSDCMCHLVGWKLCFFFKVIVYLLLSIWCYYKSFIMVCLYQWCSTCGARSHSRWYALNVAVFKYDSRFIYIPKVAAWVFWDRNRVSEINF